MQRSRTLKVWVWQQEGGRKYTSCTETDSLFNINLKGILPHTQYTIQSKITQSKEPVHNWKLSTAHIQLHTMKNTALFNNKTETTQWSQMWLKQVKVSFNSSRDYFPGSVWLLSKLHLLYIESDCIVCPPPNHTGHHPSSSAHLPLSSPFSPLWRWILADLTSLHQHQSIIMVAVTENKHKPLCQIQRNTCRPTSTDNHTHLKQGAWVWVGLW